MQKGELGATSSLAGQVGLRPFGAAALGVVALGVVAFGVAAFGDLSPSANQGSSSSSTLGKRP